ncbi:hypothetical protein ERJ75_000349900 [Trypanosoma vivax]|nr:hypothetical protein ERJ75_000349900 [Trypanosoma vivax]
MLRASGALVVGADANSHHVSWDPLRPSEDKGECIVYWCVQNGLPIANAGSTTRRQPGTAALTSPEITLRRDSEISNWKVTLSLDSDRYWITFDAFAGTSLCAFAPTKPARALNAWNKARWNEFRKLSDEFIFRGMKRPAKGADALNEAVARGIRMATKRTIPKGKGVAPPLWTPELTKFDKMVQECENERKRDALIRRRRKVLADTALGRWRGMCKAVGHGFGKLESGEVDIRAASADVAGTGGGWPSADQAPAGASIGQHAHSQVNEGNACTRNEETEHQAMHIPTHHRGRAGRCAA